MKLFKEHEFSPDQRKVFKKAGRLQWITLIYLCTANLVMYLVMGSSQAMLVAWAEDMLSLIPPIAFLVCSRIRNKEANSHFPYGFLRVTSLGAMVSALALLTLGAFLFVDSTLQLTRQIKPTIGMQSFLGVDLWAGWWMILALTWATIPQAILGRLKLKLAPAIHDRILHTDAEMNKANILTGLATMIGVIGIGLGFWWTDSLAAILVSFDILKDGWKETRDSTTALLNRAPKDLQGHYINLPDRVLDFLKSLDWVEKADVRMYENGHIIFGEAFLDLAGGRSVSESTLLETRKKILDFDWRLQEMIITISTEQEKKD